MFACFLLLFSFNVYLLNEFILAYCLELTSSILGLAERNKSYKRSTKKYYAIQRKLLTEILLQREKLLILKKNTVSFDFNCRTVSTWQI